MKDISLQVFFELTDQLCLVSEIVSMDRLSLIICVCFSHRRDSPRNVEGDGVAGSHSTELNLTDFHY